MRTVLKQSVTSSLSNKTSNFTSLKILWHERWRSWTLWKQCPFSRKVLTWTHKNACTPHVPRSDSKECAPHLTWCLTVVGTSAKWMGYINSLFSKYLRSYKYEFTKMSGAKTIYIPLNYTVKNSNPYKINPNRKKKLSPLEIHVRVIFVI